MNKKEENKPPNKKLILHFDVNKTIILQDQAKGYSKEDHLHLILSRQAWGKLEQKDEKSPIMWKLYHNHFTSQQPEKDMIDYHSYVKSLYPLKTEQEEPDNESRQRYNKQMKANRQNLFNNFVKTGGVGIKLKPEYDRIMKAISMPKLVAEFVKNEQAKAEKEEDTGAQTSQNMFQHLEEDKIYDLFQDGKYYMLPSFFKTMINLKKQKREFAIVFRTFGSELQNVIREINSFCAGEHPSFNGRNNMPIIKFDGSKNNKNFRIKKFHQGLFYRNKSDRIEDCQLVLGTTKRNENPQVKLQDFYAEEIKAGTVKIVNGPHEIQSIIQELLKESCGLGFQDDFLSWDHFDRKIQCSKPLIIDQQDYQTQHIFFDDNVWNDDDCIVDVRDCISGQQIPLKRSMNKYMVKVDIIDVIKDPDYFIKCIDFCEKSRAEEIERIEKQLPLEDPEFPSQIQKKSDFQLLMEANGEDYLRQTIMPLLNNALKLCDRERPSDPISFIALYCLKNKDKVKIPIPPPEYFDKEKPEEEEEEENPNVEVQQVPIVEEKKVAGQK
ncbi:Dpy-30 motif protein (macronuclear) [Tetrahymena thermophila SB210]|uniref:Dpy-30 motif protein n=1 Tax=Tetrahymena thermophila (strain SB210) TaxID=312017 RepID=I7LX35_TETTS|nr:Dpy-30 motif protein [Tetrahymena thermophila SB210]EAS03685.2 Dpy-30 motif protein [Tetrahymena thermophila SB210]|eukprot:XP_001023930.2 Dpy-30 motif protein [Tetrahymena thermophila SB210]